MRTRSAIAARRTRHDSSTMRPVDRPPERLDEKPAGYWPSAGDHAYALQQAQRLAELLLRDELKAAGGAPVYCITSADYFVREAALWRGWTSIDLDEAAKPTLIRLGQWRNRGPAIVLCHFMLGLGVENVEELLSRYISIAVHELAHVAARTALGTPIVPATKSLESAAADESLRRQFSEKRTNQDRQVSPDELPSFQGHDLFFLRAAVHLSFRAIDAGFPVDAEQVVNCEAYGLSSFAIYREALGDEPSERASLPISDVMQLPVPDRFFQIYRGDMVRELCRRQESEQPGRDTDDSGNRNRANTHAAPNPSERNVMQTAVNGDVDVFGAIESTEAEVTRERLRRYRDLVHKVADEAELPAATEIVALLGQVGKTSQTLRKDVELLKSRRALRAKWDLKSTAEMKIAEAKSKIDAEHRRFKPILEEHQATVRRCHFEIEQCSGMIIEADTAREQLIRSCDDPVRVEARRETERVIHKLRTELDALTRKRDDAVNRRSTALQHARENEVRQNSISAGEFRAEAESFVSLCSRLNAEVESLTRQMAEALKASDVAQAALLDP